MTLVRRLAQAMPFWLLQRTRNAFFSTRARILSRRSNVPPLPKVITIDPGNLCNLRCPLCPTGMGKLGVRGSFMQLETFQRIIDKAPHLTGIALFNWGEPLLNPDISEMLSYAKRRGIYTVVHSNLSVSKPAEFFAKLVASGLDELTLSIDGATQSGLQQYRVGASMERVLRNLEALLRAKRLHRSRIPRIVWKFIVHRGNECEVEAAERMARRFGLEFLAVTIGLGDDLPRVAFDDSLTERRLTWLPADRSRMGGRYRGKRTSGTAGPCDQLFSTLIVNPDASVSPCCYATGDTSSYGNLIESSFAEVWWGDAYRYSRSLFTGTRYDGPAMETICTDCKNFTKCNVRRVG